ncbi:aminotransferase class I/II-fold pyridoxal phosphate-dependent enzyme [Endozoicomonas sp. SM1973]|uniref:Aminotransferase class I/II-fold pyridoxal phosphate-dependent enzyme n=1 Tax=Spartinivicinus marinus TaxID=2994442 RepID=A0A853HXK0_9GAMM|nr:aminotransferase class I/II-fold pyridoxal phosphate-dependent enzyme [Spartinivicinus marinus]MCX4025232.1 aminotransferase class I/II-fold pyridoxal phosphate-dependent enzyme [Spartinivicinus marinus]NYZ65953.1 aminotransferase class I/II-fold pyridoxal phosphate-dependent enzyme [Spartinivicinus marinus]
MTDNQDPVERMATARHEFGEHGGVNMSIEASTTFTVMEADTLPALFQGEKGPSQGGCYLYGRHFNPTVYNLGQQLAALEGTDAGYCTASGMSAISSTLIQLCQPGDEIIAAHSIYGGTFALLNDLLPAKNHIKTHFVDITDIKAVKAAITTKTKVIYAETLSNPTLRVAPIPLLAKLAQQHKLTLVIDNTFSPLIINPINLGADIVLHSLTKFINGASDIIAGAICASQDFILDMMDLRQGTLMLLGPTMDPEVAFRISMRLPHLPLRIKEHSQRARFIANKLTENGIKVNYPGLPTHPDHQLFKEIANPEYGFGGILTLDMGTETRANELMNCLQNEHQFGYMAVSLGYFDTLMSCSGSSTSSELSDEDKQKAGISPGLIRLAIGYTGSAEQRWQQLYSALKKIDALKE